PRIDFTTLSSYGGGTESSGAVEIAKDMSVDVNGTDVFLVDDILDTGRTLTFARNHAFEKGARSGLKPLQRALQLIYLTQNAINCFQGPSKGHFAKNGRICA
ncbi:MAG: hypothetical protein EOM20_12410, partial [Spartobacteria bacterium]|nr:hypothetical protein [Spartobacteria bacterium]